LGRLKVCDPTHFVIVLVLLLVLDLPGGFPVDYDHDHEHDYERGNPRLTNPTFRLVFLPHF
jgi:hypothetical protein